MISLTSHVAMSGRGRLARIAAILRFLLQSSCQVESDAWRYPIGIHEPTPTLAATGARQQRDSASRIHEAASARPRSCMANGLPGLTTAYQY